MVLSQWVCMHEIGSSAHKLILRDKYGEIKLDCSPIMNSYQMVNWTAGFYLALIHNKNDTARMDEFWRKRHALTESTAHPCDSNVELEVVLIAYGHF